MKIVTAAPAVEVPMLWDLQIGELFRQNAIPKQALYIKVTAGAAFDVTHNRHVVLAPEMRVKRVEGHIVTFEEQT